MVMEGQGIPTSSELEREVPGLVTHFMKHLSFAFCERPVRVSAARGGSRRFAFDRELALDPLFDGVRASGHLWENRTGQQEKIMERITLPVCRNCSRLYGISGSRRSASTLARAQSTSFTSFFFPNRQWDAKPNAQRRHVQPLVTEAALQSLHSPATPSAAAASFKRLEPLSPSQTLKIYAQLSKSRLTTLVTLTAMAGVALSPLPASVPALIATAAGTALCAASANTLNQLQEVPFDAQMARTRNRPLVRRAITPVHAAAFGAFTGLAGPAILWAVSPMAAALGAANIALYAGAYTWLKRKSVANTWVGAVVGGLPPLIGWAACGGQLLPSASYPPHLFLPSFLVSSAPTAVDLALVDNALAPAALFLLLYSWQFPHFNSFAHLVRGSYAQAGYRMLSVLNPEKNALVALRHAAALVPVCGILFPLSGLTTWTFGLVSIVPNAICVRAAWRFWRTGTEKDARKLWHHELWYLPVILGLMMFFKQGMEWGRWLGFTKSKQEEESPGSMTQGFFTASSTITSNVSYLPMSTSSQSGTSEYLVPNMPKCRASCRSFGKSIISALEELRDRQWIRVLVFVSEVCRHGGEAIEVQIAKDPEHGSPVLNDVQMEQSCGGRHVEATEQITYVRAGSIQFQTARQRHSHQEMTQGGHRSKSRDKIPACRKGLDGEEVELEAG
ncbi:protoheme IX farnesyltransferase [Punctularia strigosozonata HHB-11173 SS5]|uniref:Protoheme IX farnesyltransferase, mitochondrial n=1 Tax=Punctularia strigosozonata (strain HHB-11173) TaxID=741275 RepID=R7S5S6_PUNST|nr:protoheme IX farnesyltransferase [Punctularia strigosozonata HHB-11173 SS5]EIN04981.1 protoheme IX farnesyltransferase [Punctularia strigosozonata HHB-11173 SS5]